MPELAELGRHVVPPVREEPSIHDGDPNPYRRFRNTLLTPQRVKELSVLRPARAITDIFLCWATILLAIALVKIHISWWTVVIAIPIIGNRYYALFIIGHDAMHRRLFPSIKRNDFWADLLILASIGAITRMNNGNHMAHHLHLASPRDPDRFKYGCFDKWKSFSLVKFLSGYATVGRAFKAVFITRGRGKQGTESKGSAQSYTVRDCVLLAGWFVVCAGGLTWFIGWWAYPLLWLLPVYVFMYLGDNFRSFCEHSHPERDDLADRHRLITYLSTPLERALVAPMNMNYHTAHHLWPSIPYYNLPAADCEIRKQAQGTDLEWRKSYFGYLFRYWSALPLVECREHP